MNSIVRNLRKVTVHDKLCRTMHGTYMQKNEKYGLIAGLTRLSDKFNRCEQLILANDNGANTDESLKDTLLDMANYALMLYMEIDAKEKSVSDIFANSLNEPINEIKVLEDC